MPNYLYVGLFVAISIWTHAPSASAQIPLSKQTYTNKSLENKTSTVLSSQNLHSTYDLAVKSSALSAPFFLTSLSKTYSLPAVLPSLTFFIGNLIVWNDAYQPQTQLIWGALGVAFGSLGTLWESFVTTLYLGSDFVAEWALFSLPLLMIHLCSIVFGAIHIHRALHRKKAGKFSVVPWVELGPYAKGRTTGLLFVGRF